MIRTWVSEVTPLMDADVYKKYYDHVPDFRKEKADKIQQQKDKALSIGVWILYERMRSVYGLCEHTVFNLSHSGIYALCSVHDGEDRNVKLGCDIEKIKEPRLKLAERFFCESEAAYIMEQKTEVERADAFYRYWVLKESFMKATRLGMGLDMKSFEIRIDKMDRPILIRQPEDNSGEFYYREYSAENVHAKIAVCSIDKEFDEIKKVELGTGVF